MTEFRGVIQFGGMNNAIPSLAAAFAVLAAGLSPQALADAPQSGAETVTVEENVPYASVNGSDLRLDIYEPAGRRTEIHPGVLLIHGGGWTSLAKRAESPCGPEDSPAGGGKASSFRA